MRLISIDKLIFLGNVGTMSATGNAINSSIKSWTNQGEKSIAFTRFVEDFNILQSAINEYKKLILKDVANISKVGMEVIKMDDKLPKFWR